MGNVFEHVDDFALRVCGGTTCHQCERSDVPIYAYGGEIIDPARAADPGLAQAAPQVEELCAQCINSGNVRRIDTTEGESLITRFADDPNRAWSEFNRLPSIPLFLQGFDWPMCCGGWANYTGSPADHADLIRLQDSAQAWRHGPVTNARDFRTLGSPEAFEEVSAFKCARCGAVYYTDQFT